MDSPTKLETQFKKAGMKYRRDGRGFKIAANTPDKIGKLAYQAGVAVLELRSQSASLEKAFLELTEGKVEYKGNAEKGRRWFRF